MPKKGDKVVWPFEFPSAKNILNMNGTITEVNADSVTIQFPSASPTFKRTDLEKAAQGWKLRRHVFKGMNDD